MRAQRLSLSLVWLLVASAALAGDLPKAKFKDASGQVAFELKAESEGAKLSDGSGRELARLKPKADGLKVKDGSDAEVGRVRPAADGFSLEGGGRRYEVKRQGAGYAVTSGGKALYTVRVEGDQAVVTGGAGAEVARIRQKGEKVELSGALNLSAKGAQLSPGAAAAFTLEELPLPLRAALAYELNGRRL